jgi:hypothetical protein
LVTLPQIQPTSSSHASKSESARAEETAEELKQHIAELATATATLATKAEVALTSADIKRLTAVTKGILSSPATLDAFMARMFGKAEAASTSAAGLAQVAHI